MSTSTLGALKKAQGSPLWGLLLQMYNQIQKKSDANRTYIQLWQLLHELLQKGYRFESNEIQVIVSMLKELPAYGANQRNFTSLYLKDEYTLRKLPKDPKDIPRGHWH